MFLADRDRSHRLKNRCLSIALTVVKPRFLFPALYLKFFYHFLIAVSTNFNRNFSSAKNILLAILAVACYHMGAVAMQFCCYGNWLSMNSKRIVDNQCAIELWCLPQIFTDNFLVLPTYLRGPVFRNTV